VEGGANNIRTSWRVVYCHRIVLHGAWSYSQLLILLHLFLSRKFENVELSLLLSVELWPSNCRAIICMNTLPLPLSATHCSYLTEMSRLNGSKRYLDMLTWHLAGGRPCMLTQAGGRLDCEFGTHRPMASCVTGMWLVLLKSTCLHLRLPRAQTDTLPLKFQPLCPSLCTKVGIIITAEWSNPNIYFCGI